ncbi:MAG: flagellar motor switch protein FliN [Pseudonocardiales bacterium]|nr:flagellar motor switch protein FliN [Pseudonocardiales bacterium]
MHDEIEFMPLQPTNGLGGEGADLSRLHDVPVELAVEIGRTRMTIGQTLELRPGSVVSLNRLAGEPVDLLINGKPIARGEVVVIDEEFGLRVTDVVSSSRGTIEDEVETLGPEPDLLADIGGGVDPLPDPFAGASVDDLPLSGLPTPANASQEF